jgi:outer membrane protein assembly factor BamB
MSARRREAMASAAALLSAAGLVSAQEWVQFARGPDRVATSEEAAPVPGTPRWVCASDPGGAPISYSKQTGVVADRDRVYATGRSASQFRLYAVRRADGTVAWATPIPAPVLESWSTPAVDAPDGVVYAASGRFITALGAADGGVRWQSELDRTVVNASPLLTSDRGPADRLFITDYDAFGGDGKLYCINIDPFDLAANPFQPGQIVWSVVLGATSGNSPAYSGGVVYVAAASDTSGLAAGLVMAFDAGAAAPPGPLWVFENPWPAGFLGGVSVRDGWVYAASYAFNGGQLAGNLVKINAATGIGAWSTPCNRTDATPVPLGNGLIAVSGGIQGFGSAPSLELFRDDGSGAALVWDSALDTWVDINQNGSLDPGEYLRLGGWCTQPLAAAGRLIVGAIPGSGAGACTDLYVVDPAAMPGSAGFIVGHRAGAGSTPALSAAELFTIGDDGLYAFGAPPPPACYANCDGGTIPPVLNINDFMCFSSRFASGDPWANCDGSSVAPVLNVNDFICYAAAFAGGCP